MLIKVERVLGERIPPYFDPVRIAMKKWTCPLFQADQNGETILLGHSVLGFTNYILRVRSV
jgi:hypothetical protein